MKVVTERDTQMLVQEGNETIFIRLSDGAEYCLQCLIDELEMAREALKEQGGPA